MHCRSIQKSTDLIHAFTSLFLFTLVLLCKDIPLDLLKKRSLTHTRTPEKLIDAQFVEKKPIEKHQQTKARIKKEQ